MEVAVDVNEAVVFALLSWSERGFLPSDPVVYITSITCTTINAIKNVFAERGIILSPHALQKVPHRLMQARRSGRARLPRRRYFGIDTWSRAHRAEVNHFDATRLFSAGCCNVVKKGLVVVCMRAVELYGPSPRGCGPP